MPTKLRKLKIDRVDLVDKGANQESHVMLFKRANSTEEEIEKEARTLQEILDLREKQEEFEDAHEDKYKIMSAFIESVQSICEIDSIEGQQEFLMQTTSQFVDLMQPVKEVIDELMEEDIFMADKTKTEPQEADVEKVDKSISTDVIALHVELANLKKERDDLHAKLTESAARADKAETELTKRDSGEEEDIWKSATPAQRKALEAERAERAILKGMVEEGRNALIQKECIAKASGYNFLPVNPDDDWEVFKAIDGLDEKVSARIYQLFKAGDTNLKRAGLTNEYGYNGSRDGDRPVLEEIDSLVQERIGKSAGQFDYNTALTEVLRERPDLYRQYKGNVQVRVGKGE